MRAVVYHGPGEKSWDEVPDPKLEADTDAIVRIDSVTICGTDLHILKGDVPEVTPGRILGHEAVGTVVERGTGVHAVERATVSCCRASRRAGTAASAGKVGSANASGAEAGSSDT